MQMLNTLAEKYKFKYEFIDSNYSWGTLKENVWTGTVGIVLNRVYVKLQ